MNATKEAAFQELVKEKLLDAPWNLNVYNTRWRVSTGVVYHIHLWMRRCLINYWTTRDVSSLFSKATVILNRRNASNIAIKHFMDTHILRKHKYVSNLNKTSHMSQNKITELHT